MGNPDLVIVFNGGMASFVINGTDYETRKEAIDIGISKYGEYVTEIEDIEVTTEELYYDIK